MQSDASSALWRVHTTKQCLSENGYGSMELMGGCEGCGWYIYIYVDGVGGWCVRGVSGVGGAVV